MTIDLTLWFIQGMLICYFAVKFGKQAKNNASTKEVWRKPLIWLIFVVTVISVVFSVIWILRLEIGLAASSEARLSSLGTIEFIGQLIGRIIVGPVLSTLVTSVLWLPIFLYFSRKPNSGGRPPRTQESAP